MVDAVEQVDDTGGFRGSVTPAQMWIILQKHINDIWAVIDAMPEKAELKKKTAEMGEDFVEDFLGDDRDDIAMQTSWNGMELED